MFAGSVAENTPTGTGLKAMVDYINENGGGTLKATDYYDTALGDATSMVQGLQQGTIDIGVSGTAYFSGLVPEVEVFQLPLTTWRRPEQLLMGLLQKKYLRSLPKRESWDWLSGKTVSANSAIM